MSEHAQEWTLSRRFRTGHGEIAYDVLGSGPPVVLVHGTPASSYLWRQVAPRLAQQHQVYVFDLLGFGSSERHLEQTLGIKVHARVLSELTAHWALDRPALVGHDIGGAVVLRAHLLEGVAVSTLALVDAVALRPWITPASRHIRANLETYATMPNEVFSEVIGAHLRRTVSRPMSEHDYHRLFDQWAGAAGQALWLQNVTQHDEQHTADFEELLPTIAVPTLIVWGAEDQWLDPERSAQLQRRIPGSQRTVVPDAGHFVMEDQPEQVAELLDGFLASATDQP